MLAHAVAPNEDIKGLSEPTVSQGRIVAAALSMELVAADFHAGMGFAQRLASGIHKASCLFSSLVCG